MVVIIRIWNKLNSFILGLEESIVVKVIIIFILVNFEGWIWKLVILIYCCVFRVEVFRVCIVIREILVKM